MSRTNAPIFIVGANRSGTTLLRLILNAHPRIAIPDELAYFNWNFRRASFTPWQAPSCSRSQYNQFVDRFLNRNEEVLAPLAIETLRNEILSAASPNLRHPYAHSLRAWAEQFGKARWGEKTPGNLFYVDIIYDMFPEARFIYLMRDPRAGVHSMNRSVLFAHDSVINALNRRKYMQDGLALLRDTVPADQRMLLKYETLVATPEETTRDVCNFLGEDFAPQMLEFHQDAQRFMKGRAVQQFNQAATQPIKKSKIDTWKDHLSKEDVAIIEWICRDAMQQHEYPVSGYRPSLWTRGIAWLKTIYWRRQCRRFPRSPEYVHQDPVLARFRNQVRNYLPHVASQ